MNPEADAMITRLRMSPIPLERGWFRETWRSETVLLLPGRAGRSVDKPVGTAILALFCDDPDGFAAYPDRAERIRRHRS